MESAGAPGMNANTAPPHARNAGYGTPSLRATAARATAASSNPRRASNSLIALRTHRTMTQEGQPYMPRGRPLELEQELIEAFRHSGLVSEYLTSVLPTAIWRATPPGGRGRSIAAIV